MRRLIFLIPILILSCAPSGDMTRSEREEDFTKYEKSFNPADYDDEIRVEEKKKEKVELKPKEKTEQEIVHGFRIQIAMTKEISEANTIKSELTDLFPEQNVYVIFESPYYKIRLGNFPDRDSANKILSKIIDKGYKSAWVVPDKVIRKW